VYRKIVYIEKQIAAHHAVPAVLKRLGNPQVVEINHYKELLNQTSSDWRLQKQVQKIILAKRTDNFYYKGSSVTSHFGYKHFYYNTLALNCVFDCDYCYLQGMFNTPHLVMFLNNEDFIDATMQLLKRIDAPVYFAISYDTDLLAIENIYPYCKEWIHFSQQQKKLTIEIRTKSAYIKPLVESAPGDNVIIAYTLSPQEVVRWHELQTPPLLSRIKAIKAVLAQGWRVRICIDPILLVPEWKQAYLNLFELMQQHFDLPQIDSFSLGVFRMNQDFLKRIRQQRSDTAVLFGNFEKQGDIVSYPRYIKEAMLHEISNIIRHYASDAKIYMI
jgi:spore photoproduct lyase